jgi:adenosylcobinamide-GDP ribazoletransferase
MFGSIRLAFAMFSKIPMGRPEWSERSLRYMLMAFPLVGIVIGAASFAWLRASDALALPDTLRALGMTLLPLALTGGIHLDGLCDTCDALGSNAPPERRREILKDPRAGAFGVIGVAAYLLAYFAIALEFPRDIYSELLLCLGFVCSRIYSALGVLTLPTAKDGTVKQFSAAANRRSVAVMYGWLLVTYLFTTFLSVWTRPLMIANILRANVFFLAPTFVYMHLKITAKRKFGGMSGDLAGWFLQLAELLQLAALVLWRFFI